jgi:hypothetical protein
VALAASFDTDADDITPRPMGARATAAGATAGRYEGSVKRESDGATYLRAIELGPPSGDGSQPIRCYEQVGGALPSTPQGSGEATVLGPFVLFGYTDSVAKRKYFCATFGSFMISTSTSVYADGRPDVKLAGLLRRV